MAFNACSTVAKQHGQLETGLGRGQQIRPTRLHGHKGVSTPFFLDILTPWIFVYVCVLWMCAWVWVCVGLYGFTSSKASTSSKTSVDPERCCSGRCSEKKIRLDHIHHSRWTALVAGRIQRIHFKQCILVYKSLRGTVPAYIADMCVKRWFDYESYQSRSAVRVPTSCCHQPREQLSDVEVSCTLVHLCGMHYHITFETLTLHSISWVMDLNHL